MIIDNEVIDKINNILIEKINPYLIYLFGSSVNGNMREDSDLDIAFFSDTDTSSYEVFITAQEIASRINIDVDLIDLKKSSTVFKAQVIGTGKVIYCTDNLRRMYFEMRSFKEYALLNEEREVILKAIKKRGSIYGK